MPRRDLNARQVDTLDQLLEAARIELDEVGHEVLTIRTVATRAGFSSATAYNYFASRDHLFAELFWRHLATSELPALTGRSSTRRLRQTTRHLAEAISAAPALAAAATKSLLGSDPAVAEAAPDREPSSPTGSGRPSCERIDPKVLDTLLIAFSGAAADRDGTVHLPRTRRPPRRRGRRDHEGQRVIGFDPYDYAVQDNPYPLYRRMRDEAPLFHNEEHDFWVLSRHADLHQAMAHRRRLSRRDGGLPRRECLDAVRPPDDVVPRDGPPRQTRLRRAGSKGFTPKRVASRARIQRITDHYLDQVLESGELDWIGDFAGELPMDIISEMLGVPEADRDEVRRLADLLVHREPGLRDVPPAGIEAAMTLFGYYADLLEERKRQPANNLTSALLRPRTTATG